MNWTQGPYDVMTLYGSFMINDLGSYQGCKALGVSDWVDISANLSHYPVQLNLAGCLPKECKQPDYDEVGKAVSKFLTSLLQSLTKGKNSGMIQSWSEITVRIRKPVEVIEDLKAHTKTGIIVVLSILIPLLIVISLVPNLIHVYSRLFGKRQMKTMEEIMSQEEDDEEEDEMKDNGS